MKRNVLWRMRLNNYEGREVTRRLRGLLSMPSNALWLIVVSIFRLGAISLAQSQACTDAGSLFQQHQWKNAADAYQACDLTAPGDTNALLYRGKALINLADYGAASASIEQYAERHPESDDALYLLGYIRFRQDRPRDSLELFHRAAKLKPPQASDLKIAALDYVLLDDYESAAQYLEQSLKMNPEDLEARYHLGRVRYQQNQFDRAIAAFREVLNRAPNNVKAEDNLGLCLEAKNQNQAAIEAYRKAIQFDSAASARTEQPYLDFGRLLTMLSRAQEAVPILSQAVHIQPQSAPAHYELGRALFAVGNFEDARLQLERAAQLDPGNSSAHYQLGRIYKRMGKNQEAAAQFKLTEQLMRQHKPESGGMASSR